MTRLPTPGGDDGAWGDILNTFLAVEHNTDGSLKNVARPSDVNAGVADGGVTTVKLQDGAVTTTKITDTAVTKAKLSSSLQTSIDKADSAVQSVNSKTPTSGNVDITASDVSAIPLSQRGTASGVATLDSGTHLTSSQLPTNVATKSIDVNDAGKAIDAYLGTPLAIASGTAVADLDQRVTDVESAVGNENVSTIASSGIFNVKDYGAVGNGSTDDSVAISAAISACQNIGQGGIIYFPAGTYIVSSTLTMYAKTVFAGAGPGSSIIKLKNGSNCDVVKTDQFDALTGTGTILNTPEGFGMANIAIDGNLNGQTSGICWRVYGANYRVRNVEMYNGKSGIVYSEWGNGGENPMEAHWSDFKLHHTEGIGLDWQGPHDSQFVQGIVYSLSRSGESNTYLMTEAIKTSGHAVGEHFIMCHTWGKLNYGFDFQQIATATDCVAEGAKLVNVVMLINNTRWIGGEVYGDASNSADVGFQLGDSTHGLNLCHIDGVYLHSFLSSGSTPIKVVSSFGHNRIYAQYRRQSGTQSSPISGSLASSDVVDITHGDGTNITYRAGVNGRIINYYSDGFSTKTVTIDSSSSGRIAVRGLNIREGSADAKQGVATLVGGTVTVNTTGIASNSRVQLTGQDDNVQGALRKSSQVDGTSFVITSSNSADSGVVAWTILDPAGTLLT